MRKQWTTAAAQNVSAKSSLKRRADRHGEAEFTAFSRPRQAGRRPRSKWNSAEKPNDMTQTLTQQGQKEAKLKSEIERREQREAGEGSR